MVATSGELPVFTAVKPAILPVPLAAKPMEALLLVQMKVVPATVPLKLMAATFSSAQTTLFVTLLMVGAGLTVNVNVMGVPVQVLPPLEYWGVTVMVATTGVDPLFLAEKEGMLPVPEAPSPMVVLLFVQLNTVPGTSPENVTVEVAASLQAT